MTYELWHCKRLGLSQNLVLPLPEPPTISTFLFRAVLGSLGRLFMVRLSVRVRMTLFSNTGSANGSMSFRPPHLALPYSSPWRYFLAFLLRTYTTSRNAAPMASPMHRSKGWKLGMGFPHAVPIEVKKPRSFVEMSVPSAIRHASPILEQNSPMMA